VSRALAVLAATAVGVAAVAGAGPAAARTAKVGASTPCKLVTGAEAQAILKRQVQTTTALQGPTCVYRIRNSKQQMTLSVQKVSFSALKKVAKVVSSTTSGGHTLYCLKYGGSLTVVPLSGGRTLQVGGSCTPGFKFARTALKRL